MEKSIKDSFFIKLLTLLCFMLSITHGYAQEAKKNLANEKELVENRKNDSIAEDKVLQNEKINTAVEDLRQTPIITEETVKIISYLFFVIMLVLIILFFIKTYLMKQYFGFQSIKFIGLVIMFPGICIVALMGGNLISGQTLAALFGTIAGYVLSKDDDSVKDNLVKDRDTLKTECDSLTKVKEILTQQNETLIARVEELEAASEKKE